MKMMIRGCKEAGSYDGPSVKGKPWVEHASSRKELEIVVERRERECDIIEEIVTEGKAPKYVIDYCRRYGVKLTENI